MLITFRRENKQQNEQQLEGRKRKTNIAATTVIAQDCMSFTFTHFSRFTYFLLRDDVRKRGLCCRRCPSARLSVTFVYCIQTAEDNVKLFLDPRMGSKNRIMWLAALYIAT